MSQVIVAIITPKEGRTQEVLDAFQRQSPLVQAEEGCELYAVHTDQDGLVVVVERWATPQAMQAHANGAAFGGLMERAKDALAKPLEIHSLRSVPLGDPGKGTIQ